MTMENEIWSTEQLRRINEDPALLSLLYDLGLLPETVLAHIRAAREDERSKILKERDDLRAALDRDKTGLAAALSKIRDEVKARRWICDGRGPYTHDDDRYRQETGFALDAIEKTAAESLAASGKLAHEALCRAEAAICRAEGISKKED
jgi:hypothetical protein